MDYSGWEGIRAEDEEDEKQGTTQPGIEAPVDCPAENLAAHAYLANVAPALLPAMEAARRDDLLRFLRAQDAGNLPSNIVLSTRICEFLVQHPHVATMRTLNGLSQLAMKVAFGSEGSSAPQRCTPILLSGVNTLAACAEYGVVPLFALICTPQTDEARAARRRYDDRHFGRDHMLSLSGLGSYSSGARAEVPADVHADGAPACRIL